MSEYGITEKGFQIKRLDEIMNSVTQKLSAAYGFDVSMNEQTFLYVMNTTYAEQIAELWEEAQDSYYSMSPSSAEGKNLDNAMQFGGIKREPARKTYYKIHCSGADGTVIPSGTIIAADTQPQVNLLCSQDYKISREYCNHISIRILAVEEAIYSIKINDDEFTYQSKSTDSESDIIANLKGIIALQDISVSVEDAVLILKESDISKSNIVILSDNLTSVEVTTIIQFETEEYGSIKLPRNSISQIITNVNGLASVSNKLDPLLGRLQEADWEARQSYIQKTFFRSSAMIESIVSALLNNVVGIESATGYQNDTSEIDANGLAPHSIEIIVDGGSQDEIVQTILEKKAAGIQTNGNIVNTVPGINGEPIEIRFSRPEYLFLWLKVELKQVTLGANKPPIQSNYKQIVTDAILQTYQDLKSGDSFYSQLCLGRIYNAISGIASIKIKAAHESKSDIIPSVYEFENVMVAPRQKIILSTDRIEVSIVDT